MKVQHELRETGHAKILKRAEGWRKFIPLFGWLSGRFWVMQRR
jgi:hypothetical protein